MAAAESTNVAAAHVTTAHMTTTAVAAATAVAATTACARLAANADNGQRNRHQRYEGLAFHDPLRFVSSCNYKSGANLRASLSAIRLGSHVQVTTLFRWLTLSTCLRLPPSWASPLFYAASMGCVLGFRRIATNLLSESPADLDARRIGRGLVDRSH